MDVFHKRIPLNMNLSLYSTNNIVNRKFRVYTLIIIVKDIHIIIGKKK